MNRVDVSWVFSSSNSFLSRPYHWRTPSLFYSTLQPRDQTPNKCDCIKEYFFCFIVSLNHKIWETGILWLPDECLSSSSPPPPFIDKLNHLGIGKWLLSYAEEQNVIPLLKWYLRPLTHSLPYRLTFSHRVYYSCYCCSRDMIAGEECCTEEKLTQTMRILAVNLKGEEECHKLIFAKIPI